MNPYKSFKIIINKKAQKFLETLSQSDHKKIVLKIKDLTTENFETLNIKKLQGYINLFRIKINDYRVIFVVIKDKNIIVIATIGNRKDIYDIIKRMSFKDFQ